MYLHGMIYSMVFRFITSGIGKVRSALAKTHRMLGDKVQRIVGKRVDEEMIEDLEEALYEADFGVEATQEIVEDIRKRAKYDPTMTGDAIVKSIKEDLVALLDKNNDISIHDNAPTVILIVGVNGSGKTTATAKLAKKFTDMGKTVLLSASDTFRAAAIEQLELWSKQLNVDIVKGQPNNDPAAVVFDAVTAAKSRRIDIAIIDTAGRLHGKKDLMHELEKMHKVCAKIIPDAPHETLLVLDATTGQNAVDQALTFHSYTPITGIILAKLDGTAKGGIAIAIQRKLGVPIKFIGVGEGIDDLEPFDHESFVDSLLYTQ